MTSESFVDFMTRATGFAPYPYQDRLAKDGLPEVLRAPTGTGKTVAAVLPWLYRRRIGPSPVIRGATPRRLIVALPMRSLVTQTIDEVRAWIAALGWSDDIGVEQLLGGDTRQDGRWRLDPSADVILVGTVDMLLSRALNRGYAMGKGSWPIDFGLVSNDTQWVFDEIQLMGPSLPTSRQLQAWRERFGTYGPTRSMWMSATLDLATFETVDSPAPTEVFELLEDDKSHERLRTRIQAARTIRELAVPDEGLASAILDIHRPGTRTIVFHNTVARAQATFKDLTKADPEPDVVLIHSRFRPPDRERAMQRVVMEPGASGTIVVATQALEAGVDITSAVMITELAPWSSVVQRAGRCNRYGTQEDPTLYWFEPESEAPYEPAALLASKAVLRTLEGEARSGSELASVEIDVVQPLYLTLRRKDLIELFDTAPDLSGNDIDVSRFIRDGDDVAVRIAWRDLTGDKSPRAVLPRETATPTRNELCAAPVAPVRKAVQGRGATPIWRFDYEADQWQLCRRASDVVPGSVLLADTSFGRYSPAIGFNDSRTAVRPLRDLIESAEADTLTTVDIGAGDTATSATGVWVPLSAHLRHAGNHARYLTSGLSAHLPEHIQNIIVRAAELHDVGKSHPVFQDTLARSAGDDEPDLLDGKELWAKSSGRRRARHKRKHFSHALAGGLALMDERAAHLLEGVSDPDLVRFLVAGHHGYSRLGLRSAPEETRPPEVGRQVIQGLWHGEELPGTETPVGVLPTVELSLSPARLGDARSWTGMALGLRDQPDLGMFRLGYLEALVRMADWRASADEAGDL